MNSSFDTKLKQRGSNRRSRASSRRHWTGKESDKPISVNSNGEEAQENRTIAGIPTYNEEVAIRNVVASSQKYADEVNDVDDGSTDRTVEIALVVDATVNKYKENTGKGRTERMLKGQRGVRM